MIVPGAVTIFPGDSEEREPVTGPTFVGVDPGKAGSYAVLWSSGKVETGEIPVLKSTRKRGGRTEYDVPGIVELVGEWRKFSGDGLFVTLERSQALPASLGGGIANFNRGVSSGGWTWLLVSMAIAFQAVPAQKWQKTMLAGTPGTDTKQRSITAAGRLFPEVSLLRTERSRKPDDGMADALLLAEYGRRTWKGELCDG